MKYIIVLLILVGIYIVYLHNEAFEHIVVTNQGCAQEGEYTKRDCCNGLSYMSFFLRREKLCYDPTKGKLVCSGRGSRSEGWHYKTINGPVLLKYAQCPLIYY